jgi:hypothetical protein
MTLYSYSELMMETADRLRDPSYFTPVDQVPAYLARSVVNRVNLFKGASPGEELPITNADIPSVLNQFKISGIVPGEVLFGHFEGNEQLEAVPWIAQHVDDGSQASVSVDDVRNELFSKTPMETRSTITSDDLIPAHAVRINKSNTILMVDSKAEMISRKDKARLEALERTALALPDIAFWLIEGRRRVTWLSSGS